MMTILTSIDILYYDTNVIPVYSIIQYETSSEEEWYEALLWSIPEEMI